MAINTTSEPAAIQSTPEMRLIYKEGRRGKKGSNIIVDPSPGKNVKPKDNCITLTTQG